MVYDILLSPRCLSFTFGSFDMQILEGHCHLALARGLHHPSRRRTEASIPTLQGMLPEKPHGVMSQRRPSSGPYLHGIRLRLKFQCFFECKIPNPDHFYKSNYLFQKIEIEVRTNCSVASSSSYCVVI
ncbi:hypothetical protein GUJ93_ZPchr0006g43051 [Zizania palustris]|uniref:Uncharacterized protein n=1 Tax=Zizania palustris TaxID=103762 RepID=A0A8J5W2P3_ZIZPA|nr:hypothetical protein GUJ93_ZPchr0006g43051 [Zizania palustris]KAG8073849.1 hypothetical protein GUJ93_ZPchr0006g43051 [Zizania palustris]